MSDITVTKDNEFALFKANLYDLYIRKLDEEEYNDDLRLNVAGIKSTLTCNSDSVIVKFYATLPVIKWINDDVKQNIFNKVKYDLQLKLYAQSDNEYTILNDIYYISSVSTEFSDEDSSTLLFNVEFVKQSVNNARSLFCENLACTKLNNINYIDKESIPVSTAMCDGK